MKIIPALLSLMFVASASLAQSPPSPPIGAVVQTWHYDSATHFVTVRINNISQKDITAFSMTVSTTYADGTKSVAMAGVDFLGESGDGSFVAGTSHDENLYQTKDVTNVIAVVDVVAYADNTAEVDNSRAFDSLVARRSGDLLAMQEVNKVMKQSLSDPANTNPNVTVLSEFSRITKIIDDKTSVHDNLEGATDAFLRIRIARLRSEITSAKHSGETDREYLQTVVKRHDDAIAKATPHTQLVKGGAR
jgi:hypothetical protein